MNPGKVIAICLGIYVLFGVILFMSMSTMGMLR